MIVIQKKCQAVPSVLPRPWFLLFTMIDTREFQKPRAPGHEFGIKNNFIPYGDTSEKAVPVEFVPIFFV